MCGGSLVNAYDTGTMPTCVTQLFSFICQLYLQIIAYSVLLQCVLIADAYWFLVSISFRHTCINLISMP